MSRLSVLERVGNRKTLGATHDDRRHVFRFAGQFDVIESAEEFLEELADLKAGNMRTQAVVAAKPETKMFVGIGSIDIEREWIGKDSQG